MSQVKLREIHCVNFKSLTNVRLHGFSAVTCLVGRNGRGKSNVIDSLGFALCDKALNLRCHQAADFLPYAPVLYASVRLTLDVTNDGAQQLVVFERRAHVNGYNYFFMDQVVNEGTYIKNLRWCGVNPIHSTFLVYQEKIRSFTTKTPSELMSYFVKLSGCEAVDAELAEIKKKLVTLDDASKKFIAEKNALVDKHRSSVKKLKTDKEQDRQLALCNKAEMHTVLYELFSLNAVIRETLKGVAGHEKQLARQTAMYDLKKLALEALGQAISGLERECEDANVSLQQQMADQADQSLLRTAAYAKVQHEQEKRDELARKRRQTVELQQTMAGEIDAMAAQEAEAERTTADLSVAQNKITQQMRDEWQELELFAVQQSSVQEIKLRPLQRQQQEEQDNRDLLRTKITSLQARLAILHDAEQRSLGSLSKIKQHEAEMRTRYDRDVKTAQTITETLREADEMAKQLEEVDVLLADFSYDQRMDSAKVDVAFLKEHVSGVHGLVCDVLQIPDVDHLVPCTKVVAEHMLSIVVETQECAVRCIQLLREHKMRRRQFLPMNGLRPRPTKPLPKNEPTVTTEYRGGRLKPLDRLMFYSGDYELVVRFVCKGAYYAKDEAVAMLLYDHKIGVVTAEGNFYHSTGLVSGGYVDLKARSARWAKSTVSGEQNKLTERKNQLLAGLADRRKQLKNLQLECDQDDPVPDDNTKKVILAQLQKQLNELTNEKALTTAEISKLKKELVAYKKLDERYEKEMMGRQRLIDKAIAEIATARRAVFADFSARYDLPHADEGLDTDLAPLNRAQALVNTIRETRVYHLEQMQHYDDEMGELVATISRIDEQSLPVLVAEREAVDAQLKVISNAVQEVRAGERNLVTKRSAKVKAANIAEKDLRTLARAVAVCEANIETARETLLMHKQNFNQVLLQNLHMDTLPIESPADRALIRDAHDPFSIVKINYIKGLPKQYHKPQVAQTKTALANELAAQSEALQKLLPQFGRRTIGQSAADISVNTQRREALDNDMRVVRKDEKDALRRKSELTVQRVRLLTAIVRGVEKRMLAICRGLYASNAVAVDFQLANLNDPAKSELFFQIMPPGKSYLPQDRLSHGERTVAGFALVLAINECAEGAKFMLLDEIDSELDPVNTNLIMAYLPQYAKAQSMQVILSTHNAKVMAVGDELIGVVMLHMGLDTEVIRESFVNLGL